MYLTKEEAHGKMCPHMVYQTYGGGVNSDGPRHTDYQRCFASDCMAWRWAGGLPATEKGYCGLSGRPGPDNLHLDVPAQLP